ncbi:cytochrome P450 oxidoreductase OrdA-like protein [Phellopilus nigrolimitatus]|nr:cytochrome P450 oxidoreductase OrdA-like protein [Phellopilus nigrolimitatus]
MATLSAIPQPPTVPLLANVTLIDADLPIRSFQLLARQYGEIYQLVFPGGLSVVHINAHALKTISRPLREVRRLAGDGLFTADSDEPNWGRAHRILMPAFGTANVRTMFDGMTDICDQMLLKWERFGHDHVFDPTEDYTRLTFDTIALCSMSYRFNSFYERDMPKFTQEMVEFLSQSSKRAFRPGFMKLLPYWYKAADDKFDADANDMTELAREIIKRRREQPSEKRDLLTLMLEGKDAKTGEMLSEENITYNLLTFLIAGHETTSGMLSFATYFLLKNPDALRALRAELDAVLGGSECTLAELGKLPYLTAVMRESLRLHPTAPSRTVMPLEDTVLVGGDGDPANPANKCYALKKGQIIVDAEAFRPERMLDGKFEALPEQAWQPFGFGMRACIGRAFAWQEAALVLANVFEKFDVFLADPAYTLQIKQALTIKPKDMRVRVVPRRHTGASSVPRSLSASGSGTDSVSSVSSVSPSTGGAGDKGHPLHVLYGSNTGTSEAFAQRIASDAHQHGFKATLGTLDSAMARLPTSGPVVLVTASFEGAPADNAAQFVAWLSALPASSLAKVAFAVFGCGNREWVRTYQRIPTLIDECLAAQGAEAPRPTRRGRRSSARLLPAIRLSSRRSCGLHWRRSRYNVSGHADASALAVEVSKPGKGRATLLRQLDAETGEVIENKVLTKPGAPMKRHIEIALPEGMSYRAGDYLAILPANPEDTVQRALTHFGLTGDQEITIKASGPTTLPVNAPTPAHSILSGFVELSQPATTRDLQALKAVASEDTTIAALDALLEHYQEEVLAKRVSVLELLEHHADIALPLGVFLGMLPPMRIRQYSISSSPLAGPCARLAHRQRARFAGTLRSLAHASSELHRTSSQGLVPGARVLVVVRPSGAAFHLPNDPSVPLGLFCAGSGLAPFRGFIQERAAQARAGREVGRTVLFFGCRAPDEDFLYGDAELAEWKAAGVVEVRPAFSRKADASEGCKYVQHRIWHDRQVIKELYRAKAKFFTCGSRKAANGVKQVCIDIMKENHSDWSDERAAEAFEEVQKERYATDVFD